VKPTQFQLSLIAASCHTENEPAEKVRLALCLWEAAGRALSAVEDSPKVKIDSLDSFLVKMLPSLRANDRTKRFRDFVRDSIIEEGIVDVVPSEIFGTKLISADLTEERLETEVSTKMEKYRHEGISDVATLEKLFSGWNDQRGIILRRERAAKAGKARATSRKKKKSV